MPTTTNNRISNHLQLLLTSPRHTILTNHTCQEEGPLAVLCSDLQHHPKGTINTINLVGASITMVYVTLSQISVIYRSGAHHIAFLQSPEWPQYRLFHQYVTQTAWAMGNCLLENVSMKTAYQDFRAQRPYLVPATAPRTPIGSKHQPLTLLLAPNEAKPTQTTTIRHDIKWRIPKHHMTTQDLPTVPHDSQEMPRSCWACDLNAPPTPWPLLHLIARNHIHPTAHLPALAYAWVAPWFYNADTNQTVVWNP